MEGLFCSALPHGALLTGISTLLQKQSRGPDTGMAILQMSTLRMEHDTVSSQVAVGPDGNPRFQL